MKEWRAFYSHSLADGCLDGIMAETKREAIQIVYDYYREKFEDMYTFHITSIEEHTALACPKCGKSMINLGLIYDECDNHKCELYHQDPRPHMTHD